MILSKTSAAILEKAVVEKKQEIIALERVQDFIPDFHAVESVKFKAAHQEGRYIQATKSGDEKSIREEKRELTRLNNILNNMNQDYDEWINTDFDQSEAQIFAIEAEISDIEKDLAGFRLRNGGSV